MSTATVHPVAEMGAYLHDWEQRARARHSWLELIGVEAAQDIHADVAKNEDEVRQTVTTEEERNLLNAAELERILADGTVTADELPRLRQLAQRERRSAQHLHAARERLTS